MILGQTDQNGAWTSDRLAPGKYYALARRTAPDKSPESIADLWRNRHRAKELDLAPNAHLDLALSPPD